LLSGLSQWNTYQYFLTTNKIYRFGPIYGKLLHLFLTLFSPFAYILCNQKSVICRDHYICIELNTNTLINILDICKKIHENWYRKLICNIPPDVIYLSKQQHHHRYKNIYRDVQKFDAESRELFAQIYIYIHTHIYKHIYIYIYIYIFVYIYTYMYICIYIYIFINLYIGMFRSLMRKVDSYSLRYTYIHMF
jgi:hypothetical protein